jgi:hypothetical protein
VAVITWTDVIAHAAELSGVNSRAQEDFLGLANASVNVALLDGETGYKTKLARVYLAAHLATMDKRKGAAGSVVSQTAGPLSRTYAMQQWLTPSELSLTSYGSNYLTIIRHSGVRSGFVL